VFSQNGVGARSINYTYTATGRRPTMADTGGNVTDTYDHDAFGNLIHS
jgi:YD repeat-containing protein